MTQRSQIALLLFIASSAQGVTVRGAIAPPEEAGSTYEGTWRVENGVLPVGPRLPDPRTEMAVVLESKRVEKKTEPTTVTVELHGSHLDPPIVVAQVGATVTFKNNDGMPHTLFVEASDSPMPAEPLPAGKSRAVRLVNAGAYRVRDQELPHIEAGLLVTASPYVVQVDDRGAFTLEVPEGNYTLRVFYRGRFALSKSLEVGPKTMDLSLQLPSPPGAASPPGEKVQ